MDILSLVDLFPAFGEGAPAPAPSPGTGYHVYGNGGSGPVDYSTVLATTSGLTWASSALAYPGTWKFAVRAFDTVSSLEESNIDALVKLELDAGGVDVSRIPAAPVLLSGHALAAGAIVLDWHHAVFDPARKPTGFHLYRGTGGPPSYGSPVATVAYSTAVNVFSAKLAGLSDGVAYTFGARAYNATGEEANTATVTITAVGSSGLIVSGLSGGSTP